MSDDQASLEIDGDEEPLYAPEEKFANPRDHLGRTAVDVKGICSGQRDCKCPVCDHRLIVKAGDSVSVHFAHAPGRKDTSCKGGFETPWHKCAKQAAAMRPGWLHEYTDNTDRNSRFDAYNQFTKEAFEAVHSLSPTYSEKQRSLASIGIDCKWLFDSAGDFANKNPLPINIDAACDGLLECGDLLGKRAVAIIQEIGPDRCYLHYLGLAWKWVGIDRWHACPPDNEMQRLVAGEHGLNRLLIDLRGYEGIPSDKVAFRNGDLVSTAWQEISAKNLVLRIQEQKEQLLESWRRVKRNREYARKRGNSKQYRPSTQSDVESRSKPVCELMAERQSLTTTLDAIQIDAARPGVDPLERIHRTWREYCFHRGWTVKEATDGTYAG